MKIIIYTDGSARGNPGPGGWGAVVGYEKLADGKPQEWVTELGGGEVHTTNNRMELSAAIQALEFVGESKERIKLHTDSEYIVKGITTWVNGWQANAWRTAAKKPVLNQDLWQELIRVSEGKEIDWILVRGHSGVPANERCDVIATSFADEVSIELYNGEKRAYSIAF